MEFRILGSLEAVSGEVRLALGEPRDQKLLAVLLLEAGRMVPLAHLVDALWDDDPPATAVKQVCNSASRLRRVVGPGVIITERGGYRLAVADDAVDARAFEAMAAQARAVASAGWLLPPGC